MEASGIDTVGADGTTAVEGADGVVAGVGVGEGDVAGVAVVGAGAGAEADGGDVGVWVVAVIMGERATSV